MKEFFNIEERKPIWMALSEFYLDTELDDAALRHIAFMIIDSPYTLKDVRRINKYEVFPVLQFNFLSPAGVWDGFDEEWLVQRITLRIHSRNLLNDAGLEISYQSLKWMCKKYWERLEVIYDDIKAQPDSYIATCRAAFIAGVLPFYLNRICAA